MTDGDGGGVWGPVEAATRAMVAELGTLSPRQVIDAAQAYRLAALLDAEESGTAASALSRELRQVVATLREVPRVPAADPEAGPPPSRLDEVARRRAERRQQLDGGGS